MCGWRHLLERPWSFYDVSAVGEVYTGFIEATITKTNLLQQVHNHGLVLHRPPRILEAQNNVDVGQRLYAERRLNNMS